MPEWLAILLALALVGLVVRREWRAHTTDLPGSGESSSDDDWADQLHEINQLGKFGDLTRPVHQLTHYEVEALIRTLAVPEWVPDRYRVAA